MHCITVRFRVGEDAEGPPTSSSSNPVRHMGCDFVRESKMPNASYFLI